MISVIVPVYKVEQYLPRCVESILGQTYTDIEIILVDDGSPDKCGDICDEYAREDSRIRVIHKENGGLSDARNAGIEIAQGELITFVDSDDYIAPTMIEHLLEKMNQYGADISICPFQPIYDDSAECADTAAAAAIGDDVVMTGMEAMGELFVTIDCPPVTSWGKLYKAELFSQTGIRFPVGRINEDVYTTYKMFYHSKRVVYTNHKLYYYLIRQGSISRSDFSIRQLDAINAAGQIVEFVNTHELPLTEQSQHYYIQMCLTCIDIIIHTENWRQNWLSSLKEIRANLYKTVPRPSSNRYLRRNTRVGLMLLSLGYWAYAPCRKFYKKIMSAAEK